ncbi:MAG: lactate utilization protein [Lachnospiraceae bacterium]|jgi:L-lactate utilization protein LutB|nr:lactate utilization protein [Lachnospiraceae bacterium]
MGKDAVFEKRSGALAVGLTKALEGRHFEVYYCATGEEAKEKALELIPPGSSVSWGGSMTLAGIGLLDAVRGGDYTVLDRDTVSGEALEKLFRDVFSCDVYLTSFNAMSEDGQLVNIDGRGNRVAAVTFGPKTVIAVVGMNKVCKTLDDAIARARNTAAPLNTHRLSPKDAPMGTPCAATGSCGDCKSPASICSYISVTRLCKPAGRIKVILVGEPLGY